MSESTDPFFEKIPDGTWNACVGDQGDDTYYIDGYIQASVLLTKTILEEEIYEQRDTLILPIMFNARHAVELILKYISKNLANLDLLSPPAHTHLIENLFTEIENINVPDKNFRDTLASLKRFVSSLSKIDKDGQAFRFRDSKDDHPYTLKGLSTINYRLIYSSLKELQKIIKQLRIHTLQFAEEYKQKTSTTVLSRNDLMNIAKLLPNIANWHSDEFKTSKSRIRCEYGLSNTQFSKALDTIKEERLFAQFLGIEHKLTHLTDDNAKLILELWRKHHGLESGGNVASTGDPVNVLTGKKLLAMFEDSLIQPHSNILQIIEAEIPLEEFAEAQVLFYLARNDEYVEMYESELHSTINQLKRDNMFSVQIYHIMEKTNFENFFIRGLELVGKFNLATELGANDGTSK